MLFEYWNTQRHSYQVNPLCVSFYNSNLRGTRVRILIAVGIARNTHLSKLSPFIIWYFILTLYESFIKLLFWNVALPKIMFWPYVLKFYLFLQFQQTCFISWHYKIINYKITLFYTIISGPLIRFIRDISDIWDYWKSCTYQNFHHLNISYILSEAMVNYLVST